MKSKAESQAVFEVSYVRNVTRLGCKCNIQVLNRDLYSTAYAPAETSELIRIIGKKSVIFFTFLGTVPIPVQLGKIALFSLQLGKIAPLNLNENTGWKCHGPIPGAIKIIISNLNW